MSLILGFVWIFLIGISAVSVLNTLTFPRLGVIRSRRRKEPNPTQYGQPPFVSILIPARNESANLPGTLDCLMKLDYPRFEILVLDDHSTDSTLQVLRSLAKEHSNLYVLSGDPLPQGWTGKNWACHQLAEQASGEILVFTDADVHWKPRALLNVVDQMHFQRADLLTVWPTQITKSISERLVVPLMMFSIIAYLPEICVRYVPWPVFAAANGQSLAFRREAYHRIGGHKSVANDLIEDMGLAWNTKRRGYKLVMALGNEEISSRMYHSWSEVKAGFAKNILAGHGGKPLFLMLSTILHWLVFIVPWLWLVSGLFYETGTAWLAAPMGLIGLGIGSRALSAAATGNRVEDAAWLPVSVLLMTIIAGQSLWWHYRYGGPVWKGRQILAKT